MITITNQIISDVNFIIILSSSETPTSFFESILKHISDKPNIKLFVKRAFEDQYIDVNEEFVNFLINKYKKILIIKENLGYNVVKEFFGKFDNKDIELYIY